MMAEIRAILLRHAGGPDELRMETISVGEPGPGQLRVRHEAIGVNFHDTYVRSGLYQTLPLPGIPGLEAAGHVVSVGDGVTDFRIGDRIAYLDNAYGGYAEERLLDANLAVILPDGISTGLAAAILLKGLTAAILATRVHPVESDQWVLVHAAAGGVGTLLAQWLADLGARIIGTVGSEEKVAAARANGCQHVILYRSEDLPARVAEITGGHGADVIYDGIGHDTFDASLASLALCGHLINYGQSSGPIPPFDIRRLARKSATLTRPGYAHYIRDRNDLLALAAALWKRIGSGALRVDAGQRFPLAEAAKAHRALENRVVGPITLIP